MYVYEKTWIKTTLSSYFTQFHNLLFKHTKTCHNTFPVSDNPRGLKNPTWSKNPHVGVKLRRKGGGCTNRCLVLGGYFYEGNKSLLCDTKQPTFSLVFSQNNGQLVFCSTPEESEKQLKGYHSKVSFKSRRETGKTRVMIIIYLLRHPLSFAVYLYNTVNQKSSWTSVNV